MSRWIVLLLLPLTLLLVSSNVPPPKPLPPVPEHRIGPIGPPSFGINSHLATRYPDPSSMHIAARTVAELGITWVREDLHWHRVQPAPDVWDWTFTDAALYELRERNIHVLGVLGPSVGWATPFRGDRPDDVSFYAPDPDEFVAYARAVVTRYKNYVQHWEIWNEPDNPLFWQPMPDPRAYARLLRETSAAIKEVDPQAQVLIGGFNPFDTTFIRAVADAGAWDSFDIIAIHPYVDPSSPEESNLQAALDKIRALNYRFGSRPIWATEIGWASGPGDRDAAGQTDEQEQASFLVRSLLLLWGAGVEQSFWYMLKDDHHNPYGLISYGRGRTDFDPALRKPAFAAFRTLNRELTNTTFAERRDLWDFAPLAPFEEIGDWRRTNQPNGNLSISDQGVARVVYNFSTPDNDYVVFERTDPVPLAGEPHALGVWVYGDGSDHDIKVWLRDAEGELLQIVLGIVGERGWRFISAPIVNPVPPGDRLDGTGNGRLDFPASLVALVVDDAADEFVGVSTFYLDDITAISGREIYNWRLKRDTRDLDIIWSPVGMRVTLNTRAANGYLVARNGEGQQIQAREGRFSLDVGPQPVFLWHQR